MAWKDCGALRGEGRQTAFKETLRWYGTAFAMLMSCQSFCGSGRPLQLAGEEELRDGAGKESRKCARDWGLSEDAVGRSWTFPVECLVPIYVVVLH